MIKRLAFVFSLMLLWVAGQAQTDSAAYDRYLEFNVARLEGDTEKALFIGEKLLPDTVDLKLKVRINFLNGLAKMYEDAGEINRATPLYERVVAAEPDYYVAHRALGYIYLSQSQNIWGQLSAAPNATLKATYIETARRALPHLEKAQACDADPETLNHIKALYKNLGDEKGLSTLDKRLATLAKNCVDILTD